MYTYIQIYLYVHIFLQTDPTAFNPVIFTEPEGRQIHLGVVNAFDLHKLKLTQKEDLFERKYLFREHALAYPQPQFQDMTVPRSYRR